MKDNMIRRMTRFLLRQRAEQEATKAVDDSLKMFREVIDVKPKKGHRKGPAQTEPRDINKLRYCVRTAMRGGYMLDLTAREVIREPEDIHPKRVKNRAAQAVSKLKSEFHFSDNLERPIRYNSQLEKLREKVLATAGRGHL